jgi:hypothetical protein
MEHTGFEPKRVVGRKLVSVSERKGREVAHVVLTDKTHMDRAPLSVIMDPHGVMVYDKGRAGNRSYYPWSMVREVRWYFVEEA